MRLRDWIAACAVIALGAGSAAAQTPSAPDAETPPAKEPMQSPEAPVVTESTGRITIAGQPVPYRVIASETHLETEEGEPNASIFSVAYLRDGARDPRRRPITFVFNGGPGSASLWLHYGLFGPRRVVVPSDAQDDGAAPYDLEDNPYSLLDVTDLVFIDPVGTGWSRALGETEAKEFYGVREDAEILAEFIRLWVTRNGRWNSPKYLAGESYGTTRAAALTEALQGGWHDMALNGVMLISTILDFQNNRFAPSNDAPHIGYLPTYAATAWYHGKINKDDWSDNQQAFLDAVEAFAVNKYSVALLKGASLIKSERAEIRKQLARFTGLSETYLESTNLRIDAFRFMKELLREDGLSVGRLDARYAGQDFDAAGERFDADPSAYGIDAAYTAAANDYLTRELGVEIERRYKVLDGVGPWNWATSPNQGWPAYTNVAPWIGKAMRENSDYRVLMASGIYDLATPYYAAELSMYKNGIDPDRVRIEEYEAGHMMYVHEPSLEQVSNAIREFIAAED
ncbi:MAG: S10 family peptidase [Maricaulaceae bacterium]